MMASNTPDTDSQLMATSRRTYRSSIRSNRPPNRLELHCATLKHPTLRDNASVIMQFEIWTQGLAELSVDCVAVGIHDDGELTPEAKALDLRCREKLSRLVKRGDFTAKPGETWLVTDLEGISAERVLLVGIGPKGDLTRKAWRRANLAAINAATRTRVAALALALPRPAAKLLSDERLGRAIAEIAGNSLYRVNDLKSAK